MVKSLLVFAVSFFALSSFAQTGATAAPALNDGQIAKVLMEINDGEIEAGELARDKAQKMEVKDFAKMMIDQHKQNKKDTKSVAEKNKLSTKDSDLYKTFKDDHKTAKKELKKNDKAAFDKSYVEMMVNGHEKVLATLDNTLIPNAQNTDLRNHLTKTRGAVAAHLDHAKKLQMGLQ